MPSHPPDGIQAKLIDVQGFGSISSSRTWAISTSPKMISRDWPMDSAIIRRQSAAIELTCMHLNGIEKAILDVAATLKSEYHPLKHLIEV
jgi:hypothetical protein